MQCQFYIPDKSNSLIKKCRLCEQEISIDQLPEKIYANCKQSENNNIHLTEKIKNYTKATKQWIKKGSPKRTNEEVNHIYDDICKPCKYFKGKSCKLCGCRVSKSKSGLTNKIRMATENCPIKKW